MRPTRIFFSLLLIIGARVARAEDTVTLHMMAKPLGDVISEVARQTKLPLGAARSAASLPVFISVKEMPVGVFLKRLTEATGTEWLEEGNRRVLSNTGPLKAARHLEAKQLADQLEKRVQSHLTNFAKSQDWSPAGIEERARSIITLRDMHHRREASEFAFQPESASPYHMVVNEFLSKVPMTTVASIPPNSSVVYSTRPNRLQVALPYRPEAPALTRRYEAELHAKLMKAGVRFAGRSGYDVAAPPPRAAIDKLIVRVERYERASFSFNAYIVGPAGEIVGSSSFSTTVYPESSSITLGRYPSGTVRLGPTSAEFAKSFVAYAKLLPTRYRPESQGRILGGGIFESCTSDHLKALMRQPTKHDPLSFVVADVLEGLAQQTKSPLIAMVPDSLLGRLAQSGGKGEISLEALWMSYTTVRFQKDEQGWLIRPRSFALAADEFADRPGLAELIQAPSFGGLARYATTMSSHWASGSVDYVWLDLLQSQAQRTLFHSRDHLRLLAALPSHAWPSSPGKETRLPLDALPAEIEPTLLRVITRSAAGIGYELAQDKVTEIGLREVTEVLGNGLDRVFIELNFRRPSLIALVSRGQPERVCSAFEFGMTKPAASTEVMLVDADDLLMTFSAGRDPHGTAVFSLRRLSEPRTVYTVPRLPEPLKKEIERGREAARGS